MSILSRWRKAQANEGPDGESKKLKRRPHLAELCNNLEEAEKWRKQIISEISNLVLLIQNAGLGEFKIRDMNDHINKLLREKRHWERRIIELGGLSHTGDAEFEEAPGSRNYKYFGAARDLPGVKELFAKPEKQAPRKTKAELLKYVDCDYFGYRDEDDGVIVPLERVAEERARQAAIEQTMDLS